jgi:hypothetical protein
MRGGLHAAACTRTRTNQSFICCAQCETHDAWRIAMRLLCVARLKCCNRLYATTQCVNNTHIQHTRTHHWWPKCAKSIASCATGRAWRPAFPARRRQPAAGEMSARWLRARQRDRSVTNTTTEEEAEITIVIVCSRCLWCLFRSCLSAR